MERSRHDQIDCQSSQILPGCAMKVVLVSLSNLPAMQNYLYNASAALDQLGHSVATVGSSDIKVSGGLDSHNHLVATSDSPLPTVASLATLRRQLRTIVEIISAEEPDVVHLMSNHTWNYLLARRLRRTLSNCVVVHTLHDPMGHPGDKARRGVILYNWAIQRYIDAIVVHSEKSRSDAVGALRVTKPIYKAPLGSTRWRPYSRPEGLGGQFLVFGRINPYKGPELIPAIADALGRIDPNRRIVVAGKASADIDMSLLSQMASLPNVELRNRAIDETEMAHLFRSSDAVLLTHTSITQSGVLLDAYAFGKPVVCFDIDGVHEYLPAGVRPVSAFDPEAFATEAVRISSNLAVLREASQEAWSFGERNFSESRMAESFAAIYERLVRPSRRLGVA